MEKYAKYCKYEKNYLIFFLIIHNLGQICPQRGFMFSKSCKYGLRATIYLNYYKNDEFISINQIAEKLNLPFHFLTKIMQRLNNAGIIESRRGPEGGVKLVKREEGLSLYDVINAIKEKEDLLDECFLGIPDCNLPAPCQYHNQWKKLVNNIDKVLKEFDLNDFN